MPPTTYSATAHLRIGVLLAPPPVQLLDISPVDLFHMLSKEYLDPFPILPPPIKKLAMSKIEIYYIADVADTEGPQLLAPMTANMRIAIDSTLSSPNVQPGQLSILLIPGPDPASTPSQAYRSFIRDHAECGKTDIITICTGIYPACHSGICDGRTVTGPRGLLPDLRGQFKGVKAFEDKRWARDVLLQRDHAVKHSERERPAELWTAAGITNGKDCVAAYFKEHFDRELAEVVCRMADVGDRAREYGTGQLTESMWWVSRILRAAVKGLWKI